MSRYLKMLCVAIALSGVIASGNVAVACPMCSVANENDLNPQAKNRPQAYMYSILFMISMPATIFTGFGITFYRLSKKQQALNEAMLSEYETGTESHL